jgi:hypothetical protein
MFAAQWIDASLLLIVLYEEGFPAILKVLQLVFLFASCV